MTKFKFISEDIIKLSIVNFFTIIDLFLKPVTSRLFGVFSVILIIRTSNSYDTILNSITFIKCFFVQLIQQAVVILLS